MEKKIVKLLLALLFVFTLCSPSISVAQGPPFPNCYPGDNCVAPAPAAELPPLVAQGPPFPNCYPGDNCIAPAPAAKLPALVAQGPPFPNCYPGDNCVAPARKEVAAASVIG